MPGVRGAIFIPRTARGPGGDARQLGLKGHVEKKSPASDLRGGRTLSISGGNWSMKRASSSACRTSTEKPRRWRSRRAKLFPVLCRLNQVP